MHFLQDVRQKITIVLLAVINNYHINGLYLFWDNLNKISSAFLQRLRLFILH